MDLPNWDVDKVAEAAGLHPESVRQAIRRGHLKAYKIGRRWRMYDENVEAFLRSSPSDPVDPIDPVEPPTGRTNRRRKLY